MTTNFPSSIDAFTNPTSADTLDNPPHDQQHADINDAMEAVQTSLLDGAPLHIDDANERVGIGTTTPAEALDVFGTIHIGLPSDTYLLFEDTVTPSESFIKHDSTDGSLVLAADQNASLADSGISMRVDGVTRMRLDSSGNLGIGTTTPSTPLDIYRFTSTAGTADGTTFVELQNYVGSDLSQQKTFIDFTFTDDNSNETPQVRIGAEVGQNGDANTQQKEGSGAFVVYTNNAESTSGDAGASLAERMRIDSSGNVGIGTTTPARPLHVEGTGGTYIAVTTNSTGESGILFGDDVQEYQGGVVYSALDNNLELRSHNNVTRMAIDSSGNVGIGVTNPLQKLHVNGMILADTGDLGYGFERSGTQSSWALRKGGTGALSSDAVRIGNVNNNYLEFWTNNTRHGFMRSDGALYMTAVYGDTNAAGANMVILSSGQIMRSTSSAKYKTDIETIDEEHADIIFDLRPVWYRSSTGNEPEGYSFYGLIAEEVAEVDPRLVHFGPSPDCSCVAPEGEHLEHTKECLSEPEGVQYDRLVPHLISVVQRQQTQIDTQQAQIDALTARIEALENPPQE